MSKTSVPEKSTGSLQVLFFEKAKQMLPPNISLVHVLSELMGVSTDGAYRRIRGETALSLDEVILLCNHFRISFDSFCNNASGTVTFSYKSITDDEKKFDHYLDGILNDLVRINSFEKKQIMYTAEDPPIFHYFNFPNLTVFKLFYWKKAVVNASSLDGVKFDPGIMEKEQLTTAKKILELYTQIPSVEIWSDESIVTVIKQIEFFYDSGFFLRKEDALLVCEELLLMVKHLQKQAEFSTKYLTESDRTKNEGNFIMYQSEVMIGNNCIFITMGENKATYLTYNTVNSIITTNTEFCRETEQWLKMLVKKSIPISGVGEKQRYAFFKSMQDKVGALIEKVKR